MRSLLKSKFNNLNQNLGGRSCATKGGAVQCLSKEKKEFHQQNGKLVFLDYFCVSSGSSKRYMGTTPFFHTSSSVAAGSTSTGTSHTIIPSFITNKDAQLSIQQQYWGEGTCHGCGPKNEKGLQIRSYLLPIASDSSSREKIGAATSRNQNAHNNKKHLLQFYEKMNNENEQSFLKHYQAIARFFPQPHHHAIPNVVHGGILASILDCHSNALAAYFLMKEKKWTPILKQTVTAEMNIKFLKPTRMVELELVAYVNAKKSNIEKGKVWVNAFARPLIRRGGEWDDPLSPTSSKYGDVTATFSGLFISQPDIISRYNKTEQELDEEDEILRKKNEEKGEKNDDDDVNNSLKTKVKPTSSTTAARIARKFPYGTPVEEGNTYLWCSCGASQKQPFCDGSHQQFNAENKTDFKPVKYVADYTQTVWLCGCKQTKVPPLCDSSHNAVGK